MAKRKHLKRRRSTAKSPPVIALIVRRGASGRFRRPNRDRGEERSIAEIRRHETLLLGFADSREGNKPWRRSAPLGARSLPIGTLYGDRGYSNPTHASGVRTPRLASGLQLEGERRCPGTPGCSGPGECGYPRRSRGARSAFRTAL